MSFNVRMSSANDGTNSWALRYPAVGDMFKDQKPDIMGVQEALYEQIKALLGDKAGRDQMSTALRSWVVIDSVDRICEIMERLVKNRASKNAGC